MWPVKENQGRKRRTKENIPVVSSPCRSCLGHVTRPFSEVASWKWKQIIMGRRVAKGGLRLRSRHRARGHIYETTGKPVEIKDPSCKGKTKHSQEKTKPTRKPTILGMQRPERLFPVVFPKHMISSDLILQVHAHTPSSVASRGESSWLRGKLIAPCAAVAQTVHFPPVTRQEKKVGSRDWPHPKRDPWGRRGSSYQTVSRRLRACYCYRQNDSQLPLCNWSCAASEPQGIIGATSGFDAVAPGR